MLKRELEQSVPTLLPNSSAKDTESNAQTITLWPTDLVTRHTVPKTLTSQTPWWISELKSLHKRLETLRRKLHRSRAPHQDGNEGGNSKAVAKNET